MGQDAPRIMLYSHDTYGLGHLRRSLTIANQVAHDMPDAHQLLVTGSLVAGAYAVPPHLDVLKLPALTKNSAGRYKARSLPLDLDAVINWREQMILQAAINFEPDIVLVDKAPAGVRGELRATLHHVKQWMPHTRLVLGMRDIEDSPAKTRREWRTGGVYQLLDDVYDAILLYGQRDLFDPVAAYRLSPAAERRIIETGYLGRNEVARDAVAVRRELGCGDRPIVLVTVGGGGDGHDIIEHYLQMVTRWERAPFHSVVIAGPLMKEEQRAALHGIDGRDDVTLLDFTPHLMDYMHAADVVVTMAGYNTTVEWLSLGKRALLIPRDKVRAEQRMRATLLAERGLARVLLPDQLSAETLQAALSDLLAAPHPVVDIDLNGVQRTSASLRHILDAMPAAVRPAVGPVPPPFRRSNHNVPAQDRVYPQNVPALLRDVHRQRNFRA